MGTNQADENKKLLDAANDYAVSKISNVTNNTGNRIGFYQKEFLKIALSDAVKKYYQSEIDELTKEVERLKEIATYCERCGNINNDI